MLSEKGVIFISIDDNEQAQLKILCDEILDEKNFIACFKWQRVAKAPSLSNNVRTKYEYVLCYAKCHRLKFYGKDSYNTQAPLWHNPNKRTELLFPAKSIRVKASFSSKYYGGSYEVELLDDIVFDNGLNKFPVRVKACSAWGQDRINLYVSQGKTFEIKKDPKTFYTDLDSSGNFIAPSDLINMEECGVQNNTNASDEMKLLGIPFDYPKPVSLIQYCVNMVTYQKRDSIILDFFAGSGTTGHAVMKLNAEDGGKRKFILCTNNENNICREVTYERIKRVIDKEGYDASLKYFKVDFVPITEQVYYEYADKLLLHIKELVELENGLNFESNNQVAICLTDEDLQEFVTNLAESTTYTALYVGHDVFVTPDIECKLIALGIKINIIPDYYYGELRE